MLIARASCSSSSCLNIQSLLVHVLYIVAATEKGRKGEVGCNHSSVSALSRTTAAAVNYYLVII